MTAPVCFRGHFRLEMYLSACDWYPGVFCPTDNLLLLQLLFIVVAKIYIGLTHRLRCVSRAPSCEPSDKKTAGFRRSQADKRGHICPADKKVHYLLSAFSFTCWLLVWVLYLTFCNQKSSSALVSARLSDALSNSYEN